MPKKSQISITPKLTNQSEIVLYQPNESTRLEVRLQNETVWLSQQQMSVLFGVNRQAVTKHLKNIYESNELSETATCSILELVQKEDGNIYQGGVKSGSWYYATVYNPGVFNSPRILFEKYTKK